MKTITVSKKNLNLDDYHKRGALKEDFATLVRDTTTVYLGDQPIIHYCKLDDVDLEPLRKTLCRIKYETSTRTGGLKTTSRVFGYQPRIATRRDFCTATSLAEHDPEANQTICTLGLKIADIYKKHFPATFEKHAQLSRAKIKPEWRIKDSLFTSGIVNKNNPLKYHFDAGNFKNVCSCMIGLKHKVSGGYLSCPEYDIGFEIADKSLLIFDGQGILHGVTPITTYGADAHRFTVVYYTLQGMWQCLEPGE